MPSSAIDSNTLSMPVTVPTSPSSGASGTSVFIRIWFDDMPALSFEISIWRIERAHHDVWSVRARQGASIALGLPGQHAREVPVALDHERPEQESGEEDPDDPNRPPSSIMSATMW